MPILIPSRQEVDEVFNLSHPFGRKALNLLDQLLFSHDDPETPLYPKHSRCPKPVDLARSAYRLFVSQIVRDEAALRDPSARARRLKALRGIPALAVTDQATRLAEALVRRGALPRKATVDAFHIGIAAAHQNGVHRFGEPLPLAPRAFEILCIFDPPPGSMARRESEHNEKRARCKPIPHFRVPTVYRRRSLMPLALAVSIGPAP
jgi:hypothetical protein